jgi:hypothetical protein
MDLSSEIGNDGIGRSLPSAWVILIGPGIIMLLAEHVVGLLPVASAELGAELGVAVVMVSASSPLNGRQRSSLTVTGGMATFAVPVIGSTLDIAVQPAESQRYADASVAIHTSICNIWAETIS